MKYRINEIFYSIQGEGYHTGTPAIFIRFAGCNLNCKFCDTIHEAYKEMAVSQILYACKKYPSKIIILTGGEPTLQIDNTLFDALKGRHKLHIETNGTNKLKQLYDWVTVSPKSDIKQISGDELKLLYQGQPDSEIAGYLNKNFSHYYLQPISGTNIAETVQKVKENPRWNLSVQMHKLINIS